jgi:hypothetical protein
MGSPKTYLKCLNILLLASGLGAANELVAQHAAHQHGLVRLGIAMEGNAIHVELETPAVNLLGFEHKPRNAEEREHLAAMLDLLKDHRNVVELSANSATLDCEQTNFQLNSELLGNQHDIDDHEDHAHATHGHAEVTDHLDIQVRYHLNCPARQLSGIQILLFGLFPGVEELELQWLLPSGQGQTQLRPVMPLHRF